MNLRNASSHIQSKQIQIMKKILATIALVGLASGSAFAGCGKTETDTGKLKSFDAETKSVVIEVDGKEVKRTLTAKADGAKDAEKLVGKDVVVVSSHNKVESIKKG